jgi:hypothetical protein
MIVSVAMIIIKIGYPAKLLNRGGLNGVDDNRQRDDVNHHEPDVNHQEPDVDHHEPDVDCLPDEVDCLRVVGNRLRLGDNFHCDVDNAQEGVGNLIWSGVDCIDRFDNALRAFVCCLHAGRM